jgi:hypothetical protein
MVGWTTGRTCNAPYICYKTEQRMQAQSRDEEIKAMAVSGSVRVSADESGENQMMIYSM